MEERILDYADKLEAAITQYGPGVWQQTLMVVRVDGLAAIVGGFVALVVAAACAVIVTRHYRKVKEKEGRSFDFFDTDPSIMGPFGLGGIIAFVFGLIQVFDVWNWVAVFLPQTALIHSIIEKM